MWLESTIRDGMHLIGTKEWVFKVRTLKAKPDGENWSQEAIKEIAGNPSQPQPGVGSRRVVTYAKKKGDQPRQDQGGLQPPVGVAPEPRNVRITKQDVEKHGATPGCPACRAIMGNKAWRAGHTTACRERLEKAMLEDEESRRRVEAASERIVHRIVAKSDVSEEENSPKEKPRLEEVETAEGKSGEKTPSDGGVVAPPNDPLARQLIKAATSRPKRRTEHKPDDPRAAVEQEAEVTVDESTGPSSTGAKRRAEVEGNYAGRGDAVDED